MNEVSIPRRMGALVSLAHLAFQLPRNSVVLRLRHAMDHSVKAMHSHRKVLFSRLLNRHSFENRELEQLYRRYTVKLQQTSTSSVLVLTALLAVSLAGLHVASARFLTAAAIFYVLVFVMFSSALVLMQTGHVKDAHLPALCYGVLVATSGLCIVGLPVQVAENPTWGAGSWGQGHAAVHGAWEVLFVLFIGYSLLPLQIRVAIAVGILLPILHSVVAITSAKCYQEIAWQQMNELAYQFESMQEGVVFGFIANDVEDYLSKRECLGRRSFLRGWGHVLALHSEKTTPNSEQSVGPHDQPSCVSTQ